MITNAAQPPAGRAIAWRCGDRLFECGSIPLVMGILNVTPDSFSDGNRYLDTGKAVERGLEMAGEGAAIIDVGGESTRPGAMAVSADEEKRRVVPVIGELCRRLSGGGGAGAVVSIDTSKAEVARAAVDAGAVIINDVSALTGDPAMVDVVRESRAGVILMHMQGDPRTMQADPWYEDVAVEVSQHLVARISDLVGRGIDPGRLAVDPGIGFGKNLEHNLELIRSVGALRSAAGRPVVMGLSRKSFLGKLTGRDVDQRLIPGIAALSFCVAMGADVVRVHDVRESVDAVKVVAALMAGNGD
ncbi:MAG: dihydropteroate synthase [bacterium]